MNIRPEQMARLAQAAQQDFQGRLGDHLRQFFPEQFASLGEQEVGRRIQLLIDQARSFGMATEREVAKYADVASALAQDFLGGSLPPWASSILNDPSLRDPSARVNRLAAQALTEARAIEARAEELKSRGLSALGEAAGDVPASAGQLARALADTGENFAQTPVGRIVEPCPAPAPPDDLCMGQGFADPAQIEGFLKDFKSGVANQWDNLTSDQRFEAVKKLLEKQFEDLGIPVATISRSKDPNAGWDDPPTQLGMADAAGWGVTFNGYLFEKSPLSELDQRRLAKTIMHEGRHIEQYFKAAQFRAAEGVVSDAISEAQRTGADAVRSAEGAVRDALGEAQRTGADAARAAESAIANAIRTAESATHKAMDIPLAVAEEAARNPLPQISGETGAECENFKKAKQWFDAKWGKGPLSQYSLPYSERPLEVDAFALESLIDKKW